MRTGAMDSQHGIRARMPGMCSGGRSRGRQTGSCSANGTGSKQACQSADKLRTKSYEEGVAV